MTRVPELRASVRALALGAVALAALAAAPARAVTITVADSPFSGDQTICPRNNGTARDAIAINAFSAVSPADAQISRVYVRLVPAGAYQVLERVEVRDAGMGTVYGSVIPTGDAFWISLATPLPVTAAATVFKLAVVPRQHQDMPPPAVGKLVSVQAQLESAVSVGNTVAGSDTASATLTIDNASPANLLWAGITSNATSITLDWVGTPDPYVLVLRREIGPVADVPAEGTAYSAAPFPGGTSQVVFAGTAAQYQDNGLTGTRPYYYRVFTRDACGNYSSGTNLGPIYPGGASEGDLSANSTKPVVGILNPGNGPVTRPFKVQIRVFSPGALPITEVRLYGNSGSGDTLLGTSFGASPAVTRNANYDGGTVDPASGIFEFTAPAAFAQGTWTLRAWASNDAARVVGVYSGGVGVVVSSNTGDGKLLVRDNSSQLCSDCHAAKTHSSAATGASLGSWYVGCRACHDPHGTTNAKLIAKEITPPSVNGAQAPQQVFYSGAAAGTGAKVNAEGTGLCQVCHTRTLYYQRGATNQTHGSGEDCAKCHAHMEGQAAQCFSCHGDKSRVGIAGADALVAAAPPVAASADPNAIGAHQAHVNQATYRSQPLACENCHALPNAHNGAPDPLPFTGLASQGTTPIWNPGSSRCDATYCHGATLDGNNRNPSWTVAQTIDCDSCHLSPPGGTHTTSTACAGCHGAGYDLSGITGAAKLTHIDGTLQGDCTGCHGNKDRVPAPGADSLVKYAPPQDHTGATAVTDPQVGAHEKHVNNAASTIGTPIACAECHLNFVHGDGVVDMRWGTVATTGGKAPVWNNPAGSYTCQSTYCHAGMPGGSTPSPLWTSTAGTLACNSCHGAPPPLNATTHHPPNTTSPCSACHPAGYASNAVSGAALATHVDGQVQADTGCTACHGDLSIQNATNADLSAAPGWFNGASVTGVDLSGATTGARVGAHQAHLQSTVFRTVAITCNQCHPIPADKMHADGVGNATGARAAIAWGTLANGTVAGGANTNPGFANGTCSNTYCHGKYAGNANYAGTAVAPTWSMGPTGAGCGTCHKAPPTTSAHQSVNATKNCGDCHTGYNCTTGNLAACTVSATHLDGQYQAATLTCQSCHGSAGRTPVASATANDALGANLVKDAPPNDASGLATSAQVGAHQQHVNQGATSPALSNAITCSVCHTVPTSTTHGATPVTFSGLATTRGATAASIDASNNCSATYCHGNFTYGSGTAAIGWGTGTLAKLDCTKCHANSPAHPHPGNQTCGDCHPGYSKTGATTGTVVASTHVDGQTTKSTNSCTACHGDLAQAAGVATLATPTLAAPGANAAATSKDTLGATATTVNAVGAHRAHLFKTNMVAAGFACTECHPMPPSDTDRTHASDAGTGGARSRVTLAGTIATGAVSNWSGAPVTGTFAGSTSGTGGTTGGTCANTYCHGNFTGGNNATPVAWPGTYSSATNATTLTCNSCHGRSAGASPTPPSGTHVNRSDCVSCHPDYTNASVSKSTHVDGRLDLSTMACSSCHGLTSRTPVASATGTDVNGQNLVKDAPPVDSANATLSAKVGAHDQHDNQGATAPAWSKAFACSLCHGTMPTTNTVSGTHRDGLPTVTFTGIAAGTGAGYAGGSCTSTYCHGNFAYGNGANPIGWGTGTLAKLTCTSCHPNSPAHPHPGNQTCADCHPGYSKTGATTGTVDANAHVDGLLTKSSNNCTSCHGDLAQAAGVATLATPTLAAPGANAAATSEDTMGATATTVNSVGAHRSHLFKTNMRATVLACTDCHPMPPSNTDTTHGNNAGTGGARAQVTLATGTFAGSTSGTNGTTGGTCSSTYCHGNFRGGNGVSATNWPGTYSATLTATTMTCTSCHPALPPLNATVPHPQNTVSACSVCHGAGFSSTTVATATHMNGSVTESRTGCTLCHGDLTATGVANTDGRAAPGYNANSASTRGATAASAPGVGAHQAHLTGTTLRSTVVTCDTCHDVPIANDRLHATGAGTNGAYATVRFLAATLPTTGGLVPTYTGSNSAGANTTAGSCATNYCHGGKWTTGDAYAGSDNSPLWTNATGAACGTCHKIAPTSSGHSTILPTDNCSACHPGGYNCTPGNVAACTVGVGNTNHINGQLDGGISNGGQACEGCHSSIIASANSATHRHNMLTTAQPAPNTGAYPTATNAQACVQCHMDHNAFNGAKASNLRSSATVTNPTASATDHNGTTGVCVSCHGTNSFTKAGGGTTPAVNGTTYGASAHDYASNPTSAFGAATFTANCAKCHGKGADATIQSSAQKFLTHGSDQPSMLEPLGAANAEEAFCYRCHSTAVSATQDYYGAAAMTASSKDVGTQIAKANRHDVAARSGLHTPNETLADIAASKHAECADCHSPHGAKARDPRSIGSASAAGTTTTLVDTTKAWTASEWIGARVTIRSGTRAWLSGNITANTATQLTFTPAIASATAAGDQYVIEFNNNSTPVTTAGTGTTITVANARNWVASQWVGRTVTVIPAASGTVATRTITANTTTSLTVDSAVTTAVNDMIVVNTGTTAALTGAAGVDVTAWPTNPALAGWSTLSTATFNPSTTTAALPTAAAEWQVCFKCHSGANTNILGTTGAGWSTGMPANGTFTDIAVEFNPRNPSYHPVVAGLPVTDPGANGSSRLAASQLINGWQPGDTMSCTDCHNTDAASPAAQGPHGSAIEFMLAGVNRAWPFQTAGATTGVLYRVTDSALNANTVNGLFCRNCHPAPNAGSATTNSLHTFANTTSHGTDNNIRNYVACVSCHIRVPHGGRVSRLIVTANAPARYRVPSKTYGITMQNFTKGARTSYSSSAGWDSNGCTSHSNVTTGEAW